MRDQGDCAKLIFQTVQMMFWPTSDHVWHILRISSFGGLGEGFGGGCGDLNEVGLEGFEQVEPINEII
jgi:hypothetical protein